ncbi:uncharacterized protein LOC141902222 [Tubulanus polymorphus]|uniref:uncharacterized protein LOC141902222 n=1 Tax=Tubulanus polymorphus TaxID=672921 RepID=UPI003DA41347
MEGEVEISTKVEPMQVAEESANSEISTLDDATDFPTNEQAENEDTSADGLENQSNMVVAKCEMASTSADKDCNNHRTEKADLDNVIVKNQTNTEKPERIEDMTGVVDDRQSNNDRTEIREISNENHSGETIVIADDLQQVHAIVAKVEPGWDDNDNNDNVDTYVNDDDNVPVIPSGDTANSSDSGPTIVSTDVLQQVHAIVVKVDPGRNDNDDTNVNDDDYVVPSGDAVNSREAGREANDASIDVNQLISVSQLLQTASDTAAGIINLRTESGETITIQLSRDQHLPTGHSEESNCENFAPMIVDDQELPTPTTSSHESADEKVIHVDCYSERNPPGVFGDLQQVMDECFDTTTDAGDIPQPKIVTNPFRDGAEAIASKRAKRKPIVKPDLTNPISLSDDTLVIVKGKKCFLRRDPVSGDMVAYPAKQEVLPGQKKRGRPRKSYRPPNVYSTLAMKQAEPVKDENSAAEGLLELSNIGPDGLRRSGRPRKKAKIFDEYELGKVASDESDNGEIGGDDNVAEDALEHNDREWSAEVEDLDPNHEQALDDREDRMLETGEYVDVAAVKRGPGRPRIHPVRPPLPAVKRGRGRPRQTPADEELCNPMPAYVIPSTGGGKTVILAPQGLKTTVLPTLTPTEPGQTTFVVVTPEGTHREISINVAGLVKEVKPPIPGSKIADETIDEMAKLSEESAKFEVEGQEEKQFEIEIITVNSMQLQQNILPVLTNAQGDKVQPTMIQLPKTMMSVLMPQNTPVRLGLKANEDYLNKLRCRLCDFQAFFNHQYQDHLFKNHSSHLIKCRCCSFLTFDKESLTSHFLEAHPRNICHICHFTADYAYVIKRHMMRHDEKGCVCSVCGKRYKDTYILKMHYKMVHLPAEVLFECNVCGKKFTRKAHLKRHLRIHAPLKPFKCNICDYRGCEKSDLTKHMLVHEAPQHVCEVCGKPFRHIKNKELHVKRHKGQRDFKCGLCEFYGYTFTDIRKHIERIHSESRVLDLVCDRCGNIFKSEEGMKEHGCDMNLVDFSSSDTAFQNVASQQIIMQGDNVVMTDETCIALDDGRVIDATELARLAASEGGNLLEGVEYQLAANQIVSQELHETNTDQLQTELIDSATDNATIVETIAAVADVNTDSRVESEQSERIKTESGDSLQGRIKQEAQPVVE